MARGRAASPALQKPSGWASKRSATTHVSHSAPTACTIGPAQANHRLPVAGTGRALRPKPSTRGVVARLDVVVPHRLLEPLCRGVDCPREPYTVPTSGLDAPPEAVAALYAEFDADHSGSVSYAELCQHLREAYCATPEPRVRFELRKVPEGGLTPARTPESMTPQLGHFCKLDVDWGLGEGGGFEYLELTSETVQEKLRAALKQRWCRVKDLFVSWDSTGDGTVTRHEFAEAMRVLGLHAPAAAIDGIFCSFDPQSSGLVRSSPRPHLRLPSPPPSSPPSTPPSPPRLALAFAFTPLPLAPPEAVAALYAEFDADHSGSVSYAELCQHLREAYCATPEPRVRFELRKVPEGGLTPARTPESMTPQLGHFCKLDVDWGLGEGGGFEYLELTSETVQEKLRAALKQRWCRVKDLFVSWDSTGDGTVTRHEFAEAMRVLGLHAPAAAIDGIFCSFDPQSSGLVRSSPRPHLRLPSPPPSSPPSTPPSPPRLALAFAFTPLPLTPSPPLPPCVGRLRVNAQEPPAGATQAIPTHAQRVAAHAAAFPAVRCYWPIPATAQAAQVTRRRRRPTQPCALRRYQTRARRR